MDVKKYLGQAYYIDKRINSKLGQTARLRDMATKATASIHAERVSGTKQRSPMENAVVKLIDLEHEINRDIDKLVDFKREVTERINAIEHPEHRLLLESRYLHFMTWKEIAEIMCYSSRQVQRIHGKALIDFDKRFLKNKTEN